MAALGCRCPPNSSGDFAIISFALAFIVVIVAFAVLAWFVWVERD
ncbi:hypothetical protein [Hyphomicrobium sp.]|nr:hypothetical protein [Hyphomicrobium sp.]